MEIEVSTPTIFNISIAPHPAIDVTTTAGQPVSITVLPGTQGPPGQDGVLWFTGHGPPDVVVGSHPGDYYMDLDDGTIYELGGS